MAIDNSSAFRMDPDVPLVVPRLMVMPFKKSSWNYCNPNCSSAVALMALYPLHRRFGLKRFIASTYQAVWYGSKWPYQS